MEKRIKATTTQEDDNYAEVIMGLASKSMTADMMTAYEHAKFVSKRYYKVKHFDICLYCKTPCLRYEELCGPCDDLRELGLLIRESTSLNTTYRKATLQERKFKLDL